jgi:battenin
MAVYFSEYVINQGISPTLLFPLEDMPFSRYRDAYVTYGTLYQRM